MIKISEDNHAWSVRIISLLVLLSGLVAVDGALFDKFPEEFENLIAPLSPIFASRALAILLGVSLTYLATQLWQRKLVAWRLTTVAAFLLVIENYFFQINLITALIFLVLLIVLIISRPYFKAKSEVYKIKRGLYIFLASVLLALMYGTLGFWLMDNNDFGIPFSPGQSVVRSLREYTLIGNDDLHPHTRRAELFLDSIGLLGGLTVIFGVYSLFRPLAYEYSALPAERRKVGELLKKYSRSTEDYFKIWPHDKSYFFSHNQSAVIAYSVSANIAVSAGDPLSTPKEFKQVLTQFGEMCLSHSWLPCFMYISGSWGDKYTDSGYELLKLGEDAVVSLETFKSVTSRNKHFRNIKNRFDKEGYTFKTVYPPHSAQLLQQLDEISDDWLQRPDRREWQFLAGSYSQQYVSMGPLFLALDNTGRVLAFANQIPTYMPAWATIDLMRYRQSAPKNIMDYLLMSLLLDLYDRDYEFFNLGLAPLAGLSEENNSTTEKLLSFLYESNQKFLSLQGLRQFKDKFDPTWESKFLAYSGGRRSLPKIAFALSKLIRK